MVYTFQRTYLNYMNVSPKIVRQKYFRPAFAPLKWIMLIPGCYLSTHLLSTDLKTIQNEMHSYIKMCIPAASNPDIDGSNYLS